MHSALASRVTALVAYKTTADLLGKTVTLLVTVAAARTLSPAAFGVLMLAMTTGWLLGVASDAGLALFLSRAVAREGAGSPIVPAVLRWRAAFAGAAVILGALAAAAVAPPVWVLGFLAIVVAQILGSTVETIAGYFRGIGRSEIESSVLVAQRVAVGSAAVAVLWRNPTLEGVALALLVPTAAAVLVAAAMARRIHATSARGATTESGRVDLREVIPIGLGILVSALYFRCDVYFVEWWHGLDTVGQYNAAFRLVESLRVFPAAVLAVQFPTLCRAADLRPLRALAGTLAAAGAAIAIVTAIWAPLALSLLYGERFVAAVPALRLLALALPFFFANYALTHQVLAWDGQRAYLAITLAALVANLVGNAVLIPQGSMAGAAISTLATEIVVLAGCLWVLKDARAAIGPAADPSFAPSEPR